MESRSVPSLLFQSGIVAFTTVYAIESNRTQSVLPVGIRTNFFLRAICMGNHHLEQQSRWPETDLQFAVSSATLHIVKSVAQ
ncbi:hypothetical protein SDC9_137895 [bioreactor metagenome]|uniref:Uncharacterized protein n=1 Tax=bioreactor metagenome TaxID=1076179 RepID=A0A645DPS0_9ZZZZ